jgi:dihydropteroate synthase
VAVAALDAGANLVNDIWGTAAPDDLLALAAARGAPIVLMHNRSEPRYTNLVAEIVADLQAAIERALAAGVGWDAILVDPGFGFGKTADHNVALLRDLAALHVLGRPILLGTSRKSTLGKVLDLPGDARLEATLATTALAAAAGIDIVRGPRRAGERPGRPDGGRRRPRPAPTRRAGRRPARRMTDRILLHNIRVDGHHGVGDDERAVAQPFEVDVELVRDLREAGRSDDLARTVDYSVVDALVRDVVANRSFKLLETIAETIAEGLLAAVPVDEVVVGSGSRPSAWPARSAIPGSRSRARRRAGLTEAQPRPAGRTPSVTLIVFVSPFRSTVSVTVSPGENCDRTASSGWSVSTVTSLIFVMMSPSWTPPFAAGPSATTAGSFVV